VNSVIRRGFLIAVAAAVVSLEHRRRARPYVEPPVRHRIRNLAVAGLAAATVNLLEAPVVVPISRWVERRRYGLMQAVAAPRWIRAVAAVLLLDYTLYLWHILVHRVGFLWRFHLPHHVDLDLDATTGLRFHAGELTLSIPWRIAQICIIGVTPGALAGWQALTLASVIFHHSNSDLAPQVDRWTSWLVVTPRMHAIHHSIAEAQRHSNFSSGLAIWDHLHRTFRAAADAGAVTIGVVGYLSPDAARLPRVLSLPFITADLP
jgi:sterol desaturase/sphingolipid hydroxylase (fatty acid hydroxylase superfamily)